MRKLVLSHEMVIKAADVVRLKLNIFVDTAAMATFEKGIEILLHSGVLKQTIHCKTFVGVTHYQGGIFTPTTVSTRGGELLYTTTDSGNKHCNCGEFPTSHAAQQLLD